MKKTVLTLAFLFAATLSSIAFAADAPDCHGDNEIAARGLVDDCKCASFEKKVDEKKTIRWVNSSDDDAGDYSYCIVLQETINGSDTVVGETGIDLISGYISMLYKYGASIIGILCVFVIVISGIQISMGGANSEMVNKGKERIIQAIFSLVLLFCSALILKTINPGFFGTPDPQTTFLILRFFT